jgi:carboxyl-terminal processing protease
MIRSIQLSLLSIISCLFIMASCEDEMIGKEGANTPTNNYELFWQTFDTHYGLFDVKNVDWKKMHDQYKSRINDQMSDEELYKAFCDMIVQLNDNHLNIYPTNGALPVFPGGVLSYRNNKLTILKSQEDYDLEVVKKYVTDYKQVTGNIGYGKLSAEIGYINIKGTDDMKSIDKEMPKIITALAATKSVVLDVRGFNGGYDPASQAMASYFASGRKLYMTTKKRNGPLHADFTPVSEWFVEPGSVTFTKPVILLTSRFTQSAGETFTMAMNQFEHVKSLGDTTAGSFSDNPNFELLNGWMFSVSVGDYRGPDGSSYEGVGISPEVWMVTKKEDLLGMKDVVLEKAVEIAK